MHFFVRDRQAACSLATYAQTGCMLVHPSVDGAVMHFTIVLQLLHDAPYWGMEYCTGPAGLHMRIMSTEYSACQGCDGAQCARLLTCSDDVGATAGLRPHALLDCV